MSYIPFDQLPDGARLWIFAADRELSAAEADMLLREMQAFVSTWTAHGMPVTGSCMMQYNRFLFIAADESRLPSGCSTDEMTRRVRVLGESYGTEFLGMPRVQYRAGDGIASVPRSEFDSLASGGSVGADTIVFNNTLTVLGDYRSGKWELPAEASWHKQAFTFVR